MLTEIAAENTLAIKDLLSGVNSSFIPALQKAKTLYDSCNNLTAIDNMGKPCMLASSSEWQSLSVHMHHFNRLYSLKMQLL